MKVYNILFITLLLFGNTYSTPTYISAPWRETRGACCFCKEIEERHDRKNLIIYRKNNMIVQLNPHPYARGSLLIYPIRHVISLTQLTTREYQDLFVIIKEAMQDLQEILSINSFSIGANIGPDATGSKPGHFHFHVVPRYPHEANGFLETCCDTRLIQHDLVKLFTELKGEQ